jgi:hypothetical protein
MPSGPQSGAGGISETNHRFCREDLGADSLIPATKRRSAKVVATTPYYRREKVQRLAGRTDRQR